MSALNAAQKIAKQERLEGSLRERQALTDHSDIRARVQSEAVVCPYCEKETHVHPSNWLPHCELYHHSEPLAQYAAEIRAHIWEANDHMIAAGELLWQINTVLAHKGNGKFQTWVKAELEISLSKAYTLIKVSQQFKEHANIVRSLAKTAVYALLDAPQSAYADVENLVNDGTPPNPDETKAIVKAHKAAVELAVAYQIDDAQTIGALTNLAKTNMPLLLTIHKTGWVQPGGEADAVAITDDPQKVIKAINQIKREQIPPKQSKYPDLKVQLIGGLPVIVGFTDWQQAEQAVLQLMTGRN